jgi:hypothetical protein
MEFDLCQIMIQDDYKIILVMIMKIPILHKQILMKHCN